MTVAKRQRISEVELIHPHALTPRIRFKAVDRPGVVRKQPCQWVATDGTVPWGRFFEAQEIRDFALALLELVDAIKGDA